MTYEAPYEPVRLVHASEGEYTDEQENVPQEPKMELPEPILCQCVTYLRAYKGINIKGDAHTIKPNSYAHIGGVVLFDYDGLGHASLIKEFHPYYMVVEEANYSRCKRTVRKVRYDDPAIRGFYSDRNIDESQHLAGVATRNNAN